MEHIPVDAARVYAVVVCFNPNQQNLSKLVDALLPQVERILLVDNGSDAATHMWLKALGNAPRTELVLNGSNLGVAVAQNIGIRQALASGASHVALYDHDSLPASDMIDSLLAAEKAALHESNFHGAGVPVRIAALGPSYIDTKTGEMQPFIRLAGWRILRQTPTADSSSLVQADYLISSGMLLPAEALRDIGLMDEGLFIDYIDIEWGLRAKAKGYTCIGVPTASMNHRIGEDVVKLPFTRRYVNIHSSRRHYFLYRNAMWLYRRSYVPLLWKVQDATRMLVKIPLYVAKAPSKMEELRCIFRGVVSGLQRAVKPVPTAIHPHIG